MFILTHDKRIVHLGNGCIVQVMEHKNPVNPKSTAPVIIEGFYVIVGYPASEGNAIIDAIPVLKVTDEFEGREFIRALFSAIGMNRACLDALAVMDTVRFDADTARARENRGS